MSLETPTRNLRAELRSLSDDHIRSWLNQRRASWTVGIENTGIDGNVGSIVRGHNLFAGGGISIWGRRRWHQGVATGAQHYEPISYSDSMPQSPTLRISIEPDTNLQPLDTYPLPLNAEYCFGPDGVGLSPTTADAMDVRLGPPRGWIESINPGMLAHLLFWRLRTGQVDATDSYIVPGSTYQVQNAYGDTPLWREGFDLWSANQQRREITQAWWLNRWPWRSKMDWWLWVGHTKYPLNHALCYRLAHAVGARGVIGPPPPFHLDHWISPDDPLQWIEDHGYPMVALEHGGHDLRSWSPATRGVLVLGHEQHGLGDDMLERCDTHVSLPQWGSGQSYSVAMAATMMMHAVSA